jgi:uncharacterized membrane protein YhaH (DUF805 family)
MVYELYYKISGKVGRLDYIAVSVCHIVTYIVSHTQTRKGEEQ